MNKNKGVHTLYKNLGETPLECLERFKRDNAEYINVPMTYAGRLDPMAEGLLLALSGDMVHEKEKYTGLSKTYKCEVLWGFETDALDVLGLVSIQENFKVPSPEEVQSILKNSVGKFEQKYPKFSSKMFQGEYEHVRGQTPEKIFHTVEIQSTDFISRKTILGQDLLSEIISKISLVSGDFRQEEIVGEWKKVLEKNPEKEFTIDTLELSVSAGFYVRQFVTDLAGKLGTKATTFHIKREKIGTLAIS